MITTLQVTLALLSLIAVSAQIDFEISYRPSSLQADKWVNLGTDTGNDITEFKYGTTTQLLFESRPVNALCFPASGGGLTSTDAFITYIYYDTDSRVNPDLTMEIWIYPYSFSNEVYKVWLLGHDNGGFDRSIIVEDNRYNGISAGTGSPYTSTITYPDINVWTQVVAVFSKDEASAKVYKNGGGDGTQSSQAIYADSGSIHRRIGVNGLTDFTYHNLNGCVGKVQLINRTLDEIEVWDLYAAGLDTPEPTTSPTPAPTDVTGNPSKQPSLLPSSISPSVAPTKTPFISPSVSPSDVPTVSPFREGRALVSTRVSSTTIDDVEAEGRDEKGTFGTVIGIVIGVLVVLSLCLIALCWYDYIKKRKYKEQLDDEITLVYVA